MIVGILMERMIYKAVVVRGIPSERRTWKRIWNSRAKELNIR